MQPFDPSTWRDRVAALQTVSCRLIHERVMHTDGVVRRYSLGGPEPEVVRFGLCSPEARRGRIGCAHTTARYVLADALDALEGAGHLTAADAETLREKLRNVGDAIQLLDHRKGELEKRHALARERVQTRAADDAATRTARAGTRTMRAELLAMEHTHTILVEEIGALRRTILDRLGGVEKAIAPA